ncbi:MAG: hypothetical protein J3K34DRAFT_259713 [Monoraphidium minutum]|nr:MAG: hypothetical protein J3K34DRAFT_259713 [Monoraphidium minutum]
MGWWAPPICPAPAGLPRGPRGTAEALNTTRMIGRRAGPPKPCANPHAKAGLKEAPFPLRHQPARGGPGEPNQPLGARPSQPAAPSYSGPASWPSTRHSRDRSMPAPVSWGMPASSGRPPVADPPRARHRQIIDPLKQHFLTRGPKRGPPPAPRRRRAAPCPARPLRRTMLY